VNANVPVSIAGGDVNSGSSSATQNANSTAITDVSNNAKTDQDQTQNQDLNGESCGCGSGVNSRHESNHGCQVGCGGNGASQVAAQFAETGQWAAGFAVSKQNAVNSNAPHATADKNVNGGSSGAMQTPASTTTTGIWNDARTHQNQWQAPTGAVPKD
jgi:hypothetical protein